MPVSRSSARVWAGCTGLPEYRQQVLGSNPEAGSESIPLVAGGCCPGDGMLTGLAFHRAWRSVSVPPRFIVPGWAAGVAAECRRRGPVGHGGSC